MKCVPVSLKENAYQIIIGSNSLLKLGAKLKSLKIGRDAIIITNPVIKRLYGKAVAEGLKAKGFTVKVLSVPDGEKSKSAQAAFKLMEAIAKYDCLKQVFVVALGGGVIGDLAGYVAAAYKRGIPYVQVPTTFLAQIDSAIGGKVAVDLPIGKNLVGAFYQPKMVWSDPAVLMTLDERQIRNGLSEALKYGIIYDKKLFHYIAENYQKLVDGNVKALLHVVMRCSQIKAEVVVEDEKETKGVRVILNFGHTVGHAIEAAGKYDCFQHGEAVALGMRIAADISHQLNLLSSIEVAQINQVLSDIGLPEKIGKIKVASILNIMRHDKKFITGKNRFVLAVQIGKVKVMEDIPLDVIKKAIKAYL